MCFQHFLVTLFLFEKTFIFFLLLLRYSVFKQHKRHKSPGGDEESRTPDPLLARQVLSQLSYTPILIGKPHSKVDVVG